MRKRSVSIYAKSKDEYMESLNMESKRKKPILDEDEEDGLGMFKMANELQDCDNLGVKESYCTKIDTKTAEEEEKELYNKLESINNLYKSIKKKEIRIKGKEKNDFSLDDGLSLLCSYFKDNIRNSRTCRDPNLVIHQSNKKFPRSMSNNSITDISVKEILDSIVKYNREEDDENELKNLNDEMINSRNFRGDRSSRRNREKLSPNECLGCSHTPQSVNTKESKKNSVLSTISCHSSNSNSSWSTELSSELFAQNLECTEEVLKVMMIGSTQIGKTLLINNFLEMRRNKYEPSSGLEIKKKIVNILNKNVRIEFYDTDANFHLKDTSKIYYKLCDAFFYVVDWSKKESLDYISKIHENILNNSSSNSFFLTNLNFPQTNTKIQEEELKSFVEDLNIIYVPLEEVSNFQIKHCNIFNVFSYVLVKKMKKNNKSKTKKDLSDVDDNSQMDKMSYVEPCLSFNRSYKLESYKNGNKQISINVKRKFRHSNNDLISNE